MLSNYLRHVAQASMLLSSASGLSTHGTTYLLILISVPCLLSNVLLWPSCIADVDIIFFPVVSSILFFPHLISAIADRMSAILPHMVCRCGLSPNLGCRSETCCTWLAENTGRKKSPSGRHCTNLSDYVFATKARIDYRKKTC